jgi:hypothetical protein
MPWLLSDTAVRQYAKIRGLLDIDYPETRAVAVAELEAHCAAAKAPEPEKRPTMTKRYRSTVTHGIPWMAREKPMTVELVVDPWRNPPELIAVRRVPGPDPRR